MTVHKTMTTINQVPQAEVFRAKRFLSADDYDALMLILATQPESAITSEGILRWNSCIREIKARVEYQFARS